MKYYCYVNDFNYWENIWYGCGTSIDEALKETVEILEENQEEYSIENGHVFIGNEILPSYEMTEEAFYLLKDGDFENLLIGDDVVYHGYTIEQLKENLKKGSFAVNEKYLDALGNVLAINIKNNQIFIGIKKIDEPKIEIKKGVVIINDTWSIYSIVEEIQLATEDDVKNAFSDGVFDKDSNYIDEEQIFWTGQELFDAIFSCVPCDEFIGKYYRVEN